MNAHQFWTELHENRRRSRTRAAFIAAVLIVFLTPALIALITMVTR